MILASLPPFELLHSLGDPLISRSSIVRRLNHEISAHCTTSTFQLVIASHFTLLLLPNRAYYRELPIVVDPF